MGASRLASPRLRGGRETATRGAMTDPLDRPIWHALAGRQARFAVGAGKALRFRPEVSPFIACEDDSPEALGAVAGLLGADDAVLFLQRGAVPLPPGTRRIEGGLGVQMVAWDYAASEPPPGIVALGEGTRPRCSRSPR
jgi:hypothetical protein